MHNKKLLDHRVLPQKEIRVLIKKAQTGNIKARNRIVTHNMRLIPRVISRMNIYGLDFEDLFMEGIFGLIRAIEKFDLKRKTSFSTYAGWWIFHFAQRYVEKNARAVYIPAHKWDEYRDLLTMLSLNEDTDTGEELELPKFLDGISRDMIPSEDDGSGMKEYGSIIQDLTHIDFDFLVKKLTENLPPRTRKIVKSRAEGKTLAEIGRKMHLSRERIWQIYEKTIKKLKKGIAKNI